MSRNLKALGMALFAILAIGVVAVSAAFGEAKEQEFHSDGETTVLTGTGTNNVFTVTNTKGTKVETKCNHATFAGTQTGETADEVTVHPVYNNTENTCEVTGLGKATVHTEGCNYEFDSDLNENTDAAVAIECEEGHNITITAPLGCVITVGEQNPEGGVSYENGEENNVKDVTVTATVTGIAYTSNGFGCALISLPAAAANGTYSGTATVTGYEDEGRHGNATEGYEFTEGEQTDIWVE